jgi:IPT/TIG domain-containing protein
MRFPLRSLAAPAIALALSALAHPVAAAGSPAAGVPRVFQITPARVNPILEPNIMLVGQNLTASTQVLVGGRPAVTVEATGTTLLARLPEGLESGSYELQVVTNGASSVATDPVVIEPVSQGVSQSTMLAGGALAALFLLVLRLARPRRYAWSR